MNAFPEFFERLIEACETETECDVLREARNGLRKIYNSVMDDEAVIDEL